MRPFIIKDAFPLIGISEFISAIENNKLLGSVMGVICEELYGDCKPFLVFENMKVDKSYRNKGVGKALVSELEKIATQRGCSQ